MFHNQNVPQFTVPRAPTAWCTRDRLLDEQCWSFAASLPPLILADGAGPASQQTVVRLCFDAPMLYVRFDCSDRDIWGTYQQRNDPIYNEEVVELFLSPGAWRPTRYYEFEQSPNGVLFDAVIESPTGSRIGLTVDERWDCPGIVWEAARYDTEHRWVGVFGIPLDSLAPGGIPAVWRANLYRIERPRDGVPEYSCWSPTLTNPADFHVADRFGVLQLDLGEHGVG